MPALTSVTSGPLQPSSTLGVTSAQESALTLTDTATIDLLPTGGFAHVCCFEAKPPHAGAFVAIRGGCCIGNDNKDFRAAGSTSPKGRALIAQPCGSTTLYDRKPVK